MSWAEFQKQYASSHDERYRHGKNQYPGVYYDKRKKRFRAQLYLKGQRATPIKLGDFRDEAEADRAYRKGFER